MLFLLFVCFVCVDGRQLFQAQQCSPPCGPNSLCSISNGQAMCSCPNGTSGDAATTGCLPECTVDSECPEDLTCARNKCVDPCDGVCGTNALCRVSDHFPICSCPPDIPGNPFLYCVLPAPQCSPPCGPNSLCSVSNGQAMCSSPNGTRGDAATTGCLPECTVDSECPENLTCARNKCVDPCDDLCGTNALCRVSDHIPICFCPPDTTGNPFLDCIYREQIPALKNDSCYPNPCGPRGKCRSGFCTYPKPYPALLVPQCIKDDHCAQYSACLDARCAPVCKTANCGLNAQCLGKQHKAQCTCLPGYKGDAYRECYSECTVDSECPEDLTCARNKCVDPCDGVCGTNALCRVSDHLPICSCPPDIPGNPFLYCVLPAPQCSPPCGPNSLCSVSNGQAMCSCPNGTRGDAATTGCLPECTVDSECPENLTCARNKCVDPCDDLCGTNALCRVSDHIPICFCPPDTTGNPFLDCIHREQIPALKNDSCYPNPCGPRGKCRSGFCTYPKPYPALLVPQCIKDDHCAQYSACLDARCAPVCKTANCGLNAQCLGKQHKAQCTCLPGYKGDAYRECYSGYCRLEEDPSVEYRCIVTGAIEGTRVCETSEPPGTTVRPHCRRPNYYAAQPLIYMKCFDGYWNYVARCSPECGRVTPDGESLVVGGRRVKRGELPWHAGIYRKTTQPYMQICGGSLISNNVVLSAAHCFWSDVQKQLPASQFAVAVGKLYRPWNDPQDEAQKSDVEVIHLPPRYQGALADFQDDIAVVVTAKAFQFKNYIRPVCLSFDYLFEKQQLYSGNNGKVAGWGLTAADGKPSPVLQVVNLPFVEVGICIKNSPPDFREIITSDKICAGTLNSNKTLCKGDSGGGLVFPESVRGIERYFLRGVVSTAATSEHACNVDTYTSFTSITKHEHFIKEFGFNYENFLKSLGQ